MKKEVVLYIAVPCYNEEEVLNDTINKLDKKLNKLIKDKLISNDSKVLFINDGSKDNTWSIIKETNNKNSHFTGISLAHNVGHQNALLAGYLEAKNYADVVISMDADLQDDIDVIDDMIKEYLKGNEIVYGVRSSRKTDSFFKRFTAEAFYKVMNFMGVKTIYNHADYRLASKKVLNNLENFKERNLYLRGIFPLIGYQNSTIYYERKKRLAGESKYPLKKMLHLAFDGITSFSVKPIELILKLGLFMAFISFALIIYFLIRKITGNTVDGWTFIICSIWLIGGIQMASIGIIGEYLGKVYFETKKRPRYIIAEDLNKK